MKDAIGAMVVGGYLAMIGVTHGYASVRSPEIVCTGSPDGATYVYESREQSMSNMFGSLIWPIWWASRITRDSLQ